MVIKDSEVKVAQYGQWDGYPSGQGATILAFLQKILSLKTGISKFEKQLKKCRFTNENDEKIRNEKLVAIGSSNGWMTMEQAEQYRQDFPLDTRDLGGQILEEIYNWKGEEIVLNDQREFVKDSLFCEFAYVIDMDKKVLECYKGFNRSPLPEGERFYEKDYKPEKEYYPVKLMKKFTFAAVTKLTEKRFCSTLQKIMDKDND